MVRKQSSSVLVSPHTIVNPPRLLRVSPRQSTYDRQSSSASSRACKHALVNPPTTVAPLGFFYDRCSPRLLRVRASTRSPIHLRPLLPSDSSRACTHALVNPPTTVAPLGFFYDRCSPRLLRVRASTHPTGLTLPAAVPRRPPPRSPPASPVGPPGRNGRESGSCPPPAARDADRCIGQNRRST